MENLNWFYPVLALMGGMLGAALGALPAFFLCGLSFMVGTMIFLITGDQTFNLTVTWGPLLGPHTAFAGGIAAAAYAARQGRLNSGRNVVKPLYALKSFPVILIGGMFGLFGIVFAWILTRIPFINHTPWVNPIALSITLNGFLTRLVMGKTGILGYRTKQQSLWIPCPEENTLPWHMPPLNLFMISFGLSVGSSFLAVVLPEISGLIFGLAALSLMFIVLGHHIPVVLHIILCAQVTAAGSGNMWWGVCFGILSAVLADIGTCLFLDRGDTHIDPAALSISVVYPLFALCHFLGVFQLNLLWSVLAVVIVITGGYLLLSGLKKTRDFR